MKYYIGIGPDESTGFSIKVNSPDRLVMEDEISLREFEWSSEPPMQEGWYWARGRWAKPVIVWAHLLDGIPIPELAMTRDGATAVREAQSITGWLGPLPIPEPPQEVK